MEIEPRNDEKLEVKRGGIPGSVFEDLNMSGSSFRQVALAEAKFDRVSMARASFEDVNLSDITMHSVTMGGARFKHLSLHPDEDGNVPKQEPLEFDECDLNRSTFRDCDLSGIAITGCNLEGATIDGVLITDLLKARQDGSRPADGTAASMPGEGEGGRENEDE
jgi:uncharacterized protein YjbI with pentapeptide repeats